MPPPPRSPFHIFVTAFQSDGGLQTADDASVARGTGHECACRSLPSFSADGLEIVYLGDNNGNFSIFDAKRSSVNDFSFGGGRVSTTPVISAYETSSGFLYSQHETRDVLYRGKVGGSGAALSKLNDTGSNQRYPVALRDESRIYFASDRAYFGSTEGFDVFTSKRGADGSYEAPSVVPSSALPVSTTSRHGSPTTAAGFSSLADERAPAPRRTKCSKLRSRSSEHARQLGGFDSAVSIAMNSSSGMGGSSPLSRERIATVPASTSFGRRRPCTDDAACARSEFCAQLVAREILVDTEALRLQLLDDLAAVRLARVGTFMTIACVARSTRGSFRPSAPT